MSGLTKFFYSTMKGAPVLKQQWGSLTDLLRGCFVDGFNPQTAVSVSILDGLATIVLPESHGFIKHQVVSISGSDNSDFNMDYRVIDSKGSHIVVKTDLVASSVSGVIVVKTAALGWTEKYTGTHKSVYTAKDTVTNPFFLRVDDSMPTGYNDTWAKFARVTISDGINSIDDFSGFKKAPYTTVNPDTNENGDGVSGTSGIFGWAKWYHGSYVQSSQSYFYESQPTSTTVANKYILNWDIVGDDSTVYLFIEYRDTSSVNLETRLIYAFTPIIPFNINDNKTNCLLTAVDTNLSNASNIGGNASSYIPDFSANSTRGNFMLSDYFDITNKHTKVSFFSMNCSNTSGYTSGISFPNPSDNTLIMHEIYVKDGNNMRGKLPIINWLHQRWSGGSKSIIDKDNGVYLVLGSMYTIGYSQNYVTYHAFKLE